MSTSSSVATPRKDSKESSIEDQQEELRDQIQHKETFFAKYLIEFLNKNYQQIYDCFFAIVKDRQLKRNILHSHVSPNESSMNEIQDSMFGVILAGDPSPMDRLQPHNLIVNKGLSSSSQYSRSQLGQVGLHKKEAYSKYGQMILEDALYLPSHFSQNKPELKEKVRKSKIEYEVSTFYRCCPYPVFFSSEY